MSEGSVLQMLYEAKMISHPRRFKRYMRVIFGAMDLTNVNVLDIGGGNGFLSFYAASMGAGQVTCLEPESDGSVHHEEERFDSMRRLLGLEGRVTLLHERIEDLAISRPLFDVVILHDSVNHLDEAACIGLTHDPDAEQRYIGLMQRIAGMMKPEATLIVSDCSARCLYADLGMKNPFAPTIEWHKHQSPGTWIRVLRRAGFDLPVVRWTPLLRLGSLVEFLTGNRGAAYLLRAHFCLTMKRR